MNLCRLNCGVCAGIITLCETALHAHQDVLRLCANVIRFDFERVVGKQEVGPETTAGQVGPALSRSV
jgi:hypothetical protein